MRFIVRTTKEPYLYMVSKNEITPNLSRARWFNFKEASKNKSFLNRKTNPKTLWEVAKI